MKKVAIISLLALALALAYFEARQFIRVDRSKVVTLWRVGNNKCLVIPYKYTGLFFPKQYVLSHIDNDIRLYWAYDEPDRVYIASDKEVRIVSDKTPATPSIVQLDKRKKGHWTKFYSTDSSRLKDVTPGTTMLYLYIKEHTVFVVSQ